MDNLQDEFISKPLTEPVIAQTNHYRFEINENGIGFWVYEYSKGFSHKMQFTGKEQEILDYYRGVKRG
jgi:hypothetical protein